MITNVQLALDTNAYSNLQRGTTPTLKTSIEQANLLFLPFIVDAELRAGFLKGDTPEPNLARLNQFMRPDTVNLLWPDSVTDELYAQLWADLSRRGSLIPAHDIWIAALCIQHQLTLASNDAHFDVVPLLKLLKYKVS